MRKSVVLRTAVLCSLLAVLTSCIGIDSHMTIHDNGSGTLVLTYRISQIIADLGMSSPGGSVVPLPVSHADFDRALAATRGKVRLTKFDRSENEKDITVHAELTFDSVDDLAMVDCFQDAGLKWNAQDSRHEFSQVVARAPRQPLSEDSKRMLDAFFEGYNLSFSVEAPQPIKSSTLGTLSADRRTLSYTASIRDAMTVTQDLVMSAQW
ncbi:MAG TPA: hypothetical protein VL354_00060 [Spirochaetia bacterium]|nr:hypothetical protein [Spirochaetia bacterium]